MALFPGPPGWASARRELLDFMVQGKINRGRHNDHPTGRHSIWTNQCPLPPSPIFYRPDALPAAQLTVSKHWRHLAHLVKSMSFQNHRFRGSCQVDVSQFCVDADEVQHLVKCISTPRHIEIGWVSTHYTVSADNQYELSMLMWQHSRPCFHLHLWVRLTKHTCDIDCSISGMCFTSKR